MSAISICLCSPKGGTGKTAIAVSLAYLLSQLDQKVLLIDTDAATNGMTLLLLKNVEKSTIYDSVKGIYDFDMPNPIGLNDNLMFLPSTSKMSGTLSIDQKVVSTYKGNLNYIIGTYAADKDIIIIDAQAGTDQLTRTAVSMSDKVIIVTEFDPMSGIGVDRLKESFIGNLPGNDTFILVNKMLPELAKIEKDYFIAWNHLPPIPFDINVMRSYSRGIIPIEFENAEAFKTSIIRLIPALLPQLKNTVQNWVLQQADIIKQPLINQLDDIKNKMKDIQEMIVNLQLSSESPIKLARILKINHIRSWFAMLIISLTLIIEGTICLYIFDTNMTGSILLIIGFLLIIPATIRIRHLTEFTRTEKEIERKQALLETRTLERELERLLDKKDAIESLIQTDPEELLYRSLNE